MHHTYVFRRTLVGAAATGLAGLGAFAYRAAPGFWQQYSREFGRPILPASARPHPKQWSDDGLHAAWLGHSTVLLKVDGMTYTMAMVYLAGVVLVTGVTAVTIRFSAEDEAASRADFNAAAAPVASPAALPAEPAVEVGGLGAWTAMFCGRDRGSRTS
jgi:hypothetical protein